MNAQYADYERCWARATVLDGLRRLLDLMEADLRGKRIMRPWEQALAEDLATWWTARNDGRDDA